MKAAELQKNVLNIDWLDSASTKPSRVQLQSLLDPDDPRDLPFVGSPVKSVSRFRRAKELPIRKEEMAGIGNFKTGFLIFRSLVGIGILFFPDATQKFGIFSTTIFLPLFSIIILYALDLLLRIAEDLNFIGGNIEDLIIGSGNEQWLTAFAVINHWMNLSGAVANCIFAGQFLDWASCNYGISTFCKNKYTSSILGLCISLPLALFPKMEQFAYSSIIASIVLLVTIFSIIGWFSVDISQGGADPSTKMFSLSGIGTFFGVASFAMEGLGLIFPIRSTMQQKKDFRLIFHLTSAAVITLYMIFGILGSLALGNKLPDIVLFYFKKDNPVFYYLAFAYAVGIFLLLPMSIFPVALSFMESRLGNIILGSESFTQEWKSTLVRCFLCIFCFLFAMIGLNILDFISITGSLFNSFIAFVFPVIFYLNYFGQQGKVTRIERYFQMSITFVTIVLTAACLYEQIKPYVSRYFK